MKSLNTNPAKIIQGKRVFALFTFIMMTFSIPAQEEVAKNKKLNGGFGHLSLSGEQLNINDLNKSLSANGYGNVNANTLSFGGGGAYSIQNFIVGGGGAWLMNSTSSKAGTSVNLSGGYGYFTAGYIVYSGKRSVLYPTLGFGGGGYSIILSKGNLPGDFTQQLNSPSGSVTTNAGGWMTNIQLSYLYFFNKASKQGFFVGLKAGYKYSPATWKITLNDTELNNSPKLNMNGFYATIVFGGGSLMN